MKLWLTFIVAASLPLCAQNPPPTCPIPPHVRSFHSLSALPPQIRTALFEKTKDIVDANQPFDTTDVVMHGAHFNRFAFAWHGNGRWIVATEHGGIAYYNPIYVLTLPPQPTGGPLVSYPARIVKVAISRPTTLCEDIQRTLNETLPALPPAKPQSITHG